MPDAFAIANAFVRIRPDATGFRAETDAKLQASLVGLKPNVKIGADTTAAKVITGDLKAYIEALVKRNYELRLNVDDKQAQKQLTMDYVLLSRLSRRVDMGVSLEGAARTQSQLLGIDASMDRVEAKMMAATAATAGFTGIWSILTNKARVPLFGGQVFNWIPRIIAGVGALHLLIDGIAELLAIIVPMTYALTAFGVAGIDAFRAIFHEMQNAHVVMDATQKTMAGFSGNLEKMHDAVKPAVFALFGDALEIVNAKAGEFNKLATQSATVLQEFGARIAVAIKSASVSEFLKNAADDLHGVLDVFGNLFGMLGNFLKAMPGVAQGLLHITEAATHFGEVLTGGPVVQGITRVILLFHGWVLWAGVASAALGKLIQLGIGGLENLAVSAARSLGKLGTGFGFASRAMSSFGGVAASAAKLPWGWIVAVTALVGFFVYKLATAKDATQNWLDALNAQLAKAPAVEGFTRLMEDQALVANRLGQAQGALARATKAVSPAQQAWASNARGMNAQAMIQQRAIGELTGAQKAQAGQSALYTQRLVQLARATGGVSEAQGLLAASGVTFAQMTAKGAHAWALLLEQVVAVEQGYKMMGQRGGVLGADMNAMNIVINDQYTSMQKLNQSWDTLMGIISGGETNFITFEQDILSVNKALAGTGGTSRVVVKTFQDAQQAAKTSGASMDGLNASSLQLRQTWQTAFTGAQTLIDSLRNMSSVREGGFPSVTMAMKDMLKQLVLVGSTGKESRNELVSLAQEIDPNIHNFQQLTKWLGNTQGAGKELDKLVTKMGGSIKDLADDAKSLSSTMKDDLIKAFDQAKLSAGHTSQDINKLAQDVVGGAKASVMYHDESKLFEDFKKEGLSAKEAQRLIEAMTGQIFKIPHTWQTHIQAEASGTGKITFNQQVAGKRADGTLEFHQAGARIPGYGGGDIVAAMLEPGETVVPKHLTPLVAPLMKQYGVPGFQGGGVVPGVNSGFGHLDALFPRIDPFMGQAEARFDMLAASRFIQQARVEMMARVRQAARAKAFSVSGGGPVGGDARRNEEIARSMFPWGASQWPAFVDLAMSESGFNRFATNPSSGAYGIPQALPPTKMPFSAQAAGGSHAGPQLAWMFAYIRSVYGTPSAAWAFHLAHNWYGDGTDSAAPGLAVVGENGPELVDFSGGERVISMKKGGKVQSPSLSERVNRALRITREHPHEFAHFTRLERGLHHWEQAARQEKQLIRLGHLSGKKLHQARELLKDYEDHVHSNEDALKPLRHQRHVVRHVVGLLNKREAELRLAISAASHSGNDRLAHRLTSHLHFRESQEKKMTQWLTMLETPAQRHQHERRLNHWANREARKLLKESLQDMGLDSWIQFMAAGGMVRNYDKGGWLMPGATMAINNTSRPEQVGGAPGVNLMIRSGGSRLDDVVVDIVRKAVIEQGGGDAQAALGGGYY